MSTNIYQAYKKAKPELKKSYLRIFFDRIFVQDKSIKEAIPTKAIRVLQNKKALDLDSKVITKGGWRVRRDLNPRSSA